MAPSEKKAGIVMGYCLDFCTQTKVIASLLDLDKRDTFERLKRERSKKHVTFKGGGGIQVLTLDARNSKASLEAAMGFGSKNIIVDESALVDDPIMSTVMRMLGGYDYQETFLLKIGNPFFRNHFFRTAHDSNYKQIYHDYLHSLKDREAGYHGFDPKFIDEMKQEAFFDVYYECQFPDEDEIDSKGFRQLIKSSDFQEGRAQEMKGTPILGVDIGGGGDYNVFKIRWDNYSKTVRKNKCKDTMQNVVQLEEVIKEYGVKWSNVNIDDIGVGRGVTDRCIEKGYAVNGVSVGQKARDPKFMNLKAELSWKAAVWLKEGNLIEPDKDNQQATWIKYKVNSDKQIKLESKDDLKKRTGKSPDDWDAFVLTFFDRPIIGVIEI